MLIIRRLFLSLFFLHVFYVHGLMRLSDCLDSLSEKESFLSAMVFGNGSYNDIVTAHNIVRSPHSCAAYYALRVIKESSEETIWYSDKAAKKKEGVSLFETKLFAHVLGGHLLSPMYGNDTDQLDNSAYSAWRIASAKRINPIFMNSFVKSCCCMFSKIFFGILSGAAPNISININDDDDDNIIIIDFLPPYVLDNLVSLQPPYSSKTQQLLQIKIKFKKNDDLSQINNNNLSLMLGSILEDVIKALPKSIAILDRAQNHHEKTNRFITDALCAIGINNYLLNKNEKAIKTAMNRISEKYQYLKKLSFELEEDQKTASVFMLGLDFLMKYDYYDKYPKKGGGIGIVSTIWPSIQVAAGH